jgi:hypothetical protein
VTAGQQWVAADFAESCSAKRLNCVPFVSQRRQFRAGMYCCAPTVPGRRYQMEARGNQTRSESPLVSNVPSLTPMHHRQYWSSSVTLPLLWPDAEPNAKRAVRTIPPVPVCALRTPLQEYAL